MDYHKVFKDLCQTTRGLLIRRSSPFNTPDEMAIIELELFDNRYMLCKFRCVEEWTTEDHHFIKTVERTRPIFDVPEDFKHHSFCSCVTREEKLRNLQNARDQTNVITAAIDINTRMSQPTGRKVSQHRRASEFQDRKQGVISEADSMAFANARCEMKLRSLVVDTGDSSSEPSPSSSVEEPKPTAPEQRQILKAQRPSNSTISIPSQSEDSILETLESPVRVQIQTGEDTSYSQHTNNEFSGKSTESADNAKPVTGKLTSKGKSKRKFVPRIDRDTLEVVNIHMNDLEVTCPILKTGKISDKSRLKWDKEISTIKERCAKGWIPTTHLDPWHNPRFKDWNKFDPGSKNRPGLSIFDYCALMLWAP